MVSRASDDKSTGVRCIGASVTFEAKQVLDQTVHACGGGADARQVLAAVLIESLRAVLQQHVAEAVDGEQRGAQIVRHGIGEGLELAIRRFELRGVTLELLATLVEAVL